MLQLPSLRLLDLSDSRPYGNESVVVGADRSLLHSVCEVLRLPSASSQMHRWVPQMLERLRQPHSAPQLHTAAITTEANDWILSAALRITTIRTLHLHLLPGEPEVALVVLPPALHIPEIHLSVDCVSRPEPTS